MNCRNSHEAGPLLSIGYGNREWLEFVALLKQYDVSYVVDVRSQPVSRRKEFNRSKLKTLLNKEDIQYLFLGNQLGGLPKDQDCYVEGYVDYGKYRQKRFFLEGIERLVSAHKGGHRTAIVCGELSPETCHRSKLIGQALSDEGIILWHIDRDGSANPQKEVINRFPHGQNSLFGKEHFHSNGKYKHPENGKGKTSNKIMTIGVYGFTEEEFFKRLVNLRVEIFCDIRARRVLRGPKYAFANSNRLQKRLADLKIQYIHLKELAPSETVRQKQKDADKSTGTAKRDRTELDLAFIKSYEQENLSVFDAKKFIAEIDGNSKTMVLFCVEQSPGACHRSLVAERIREQTGMEIKNIIP